jgi:hypothetical protein
VRARAKRPEKVLAGIVKMDMEITDKAIVLTPVSEEPRKGWTQAFSDMHKNQDDVLEAFPDSEAFEWEW